MSKTIKGKVWRFKDNINTDVIIPGRYCHLTDLGELAKHCMEDDDPDFAEKVSKGDIMLAGDNFGCGSSRELAPITLQAAGLSCVVAKSFARIFYRNSINIGFPIVECPEAYDGASTGDIFEVDFKSGTITNSTKKKNYKIVPFPEFIEQIVKSGGLLKCKDLISG
jgi:3-isopropylmalate/(R)-2-methylmalate dehydratase small subunit